MTETNPCVWASLFSFGQKLGNTMKKSDGNFLFPYALTAGRWTVELLDFNLHLPTLPVHVFWARFIFPLSWDQSRNIDAQYGSQHSAVCCGVFLMYSTESGSCLIKRPLCSRRSIASIMPSLSGGWHNCLLLPRWCCSGCGVRAECVWVVSMP